MARLLVSLLLSVWGASTAVSVAAGEGSELLGRSAPEWNTLDWIHSEPLALGDLRGKVVLIRWWTDTCPMCARSAPALNEFHELYGGRGLVVVGMYHPKPISREMRGEDVERVARERGFEFPIALDLDWSNLNRYWLDGRRRRATSVSFLIDRDGIIRYIHPGPEYHRGGGVEHAQCGAGYRELKEMIEELVREAASGGER